MKLAKIYNKSNIQLLLIAVVALILSACNHSDDESPNNKVTSSELMFSVVLNATQSTSGVASETNGTANITVDTDSASISGSLEISNLSSSNVVNAVHLHTGLPGQAGGVAVTLEQDTTNILQWKIPENSVLSTTQLESLLNGRTYLNVHTSDVTSGEIRGQVLPVGYEVNVTMLSGDQQVPNLVNSTISATAYSLMNTNNGKLDTQLLVSDAMEVTAIHLHSGMAGTNGGVVSALEADATNANVYHVSIDLGSENQAAYTKGALYFNLHTNDNASGELRGQLLTDVLSLTKITLSGDQQIPNPISSSGSAMGFITLNSSTGAYDANIRYMNLSDVTAAHIHQAYAGSNGGVVGTFTMSSSETDFLELSGTFSLDEIAAFENGEHYFNLHTSSNASGELRGQVIPKNISMIRSTLDSDQVVESVNSNAMGIAYSTVNMSTGNIVANLQLFDISDVSAIHIHQGTAGSSGGVVLTLSSSETDIWGVSDSLDTAELAQFKDGDLYYNVHTAAFAAGEIRGQITP